MFKCLAYRVTGSCYYWLAIVQTCVISKSTHCFTHFVGFRRFGLSALKISVAITFEVYIVEWTRLAYSNNNYNNLSVMTFYIYFKSNLQITNSLEGGFVVLPLRIQLVLRSYWCTGLSIWTELIVNWTELRASSSPFILFSRGLDRPIRSSDRRMTLDFFNDFLANFSL